MIIKIKGIVVRNERQEGTSKSGNEWNKTILFVQTEDKYDNIYPITDFADKYNTSMLPVGTIVDCSCILSSREWQGKHFLSLSATNVTIVGDAPQEPIMPTIPQAPIVPQGATPQEPVSTMPPASDELPF